MERMDIPEAFNTPRAYEYPHIIPNGSVYQSQPDTSRLVAQGSSMRLPSSSHNVAILPSASVASQQQNANQSDHLVNELLAENSRLQEEVHRLRSTISTSVS
jgi:hypothetical protein